MSRPAPHLRLALVDLLVDLDALACWLDLVLDRLGAAVDPVRATPRTHE
jgi:hypothetical protein